MLRGRAGTPVGGMLHHVAPTAGARNFLARAVRASWIVRTTCWRVALAGAGLVLLTTGSPAVWCAEPAHPLPVPDRPMLGMYGVPASACSVLAGAGFTVVQNYDFETKSFTDSTAFVVQARAYLEAANAHSLQVLLGVPRAWLRDRRESDLRHAMRALRTHPAILAWYEDEIAEGGDLASVQFLAALVQTEDPAHGLIIEEGNADPRLSSIGRVRMFTYYPVTSKARAAGRLQTLAERLPVESLRTPFWPVLQLFGRDLVQGPATHDLLAPQPNELRFSLCSALVHGARGVFFYPYMHATTYDAAKAAGGQFAYGNYRPMPELSPPLWQSMLDCRALGARVLALTQTSTPLRPLELSGAHAGIESRAWRTSRGVLAVVANATYTSCTVRWRVPAGATQARIVEGSGTDTPQPIAAGELELHVPGPGGVVIWLDAEP